MKTLQVRLPNQLREEADQVLEEIGMDMSTAIRVYLKKVVHSRSIPFALEAGEPLGVETIPVDEATQDRMDRIVQTWNKVHR